jgi:hypothetical protein
MSFTLARSILKLGIELEEKGQASPGSPDALTIHLG